jgi:hypothetical protein
MGHYDVALLNEIHCLSIELPLDGPTFAVPTTWVNGRLFTSTSEKPGILAIPQHGKNEANLLEYADTSNENRMNAHKIRHSRLAKLQNVRFAVLPVHTIEEQALFKKLMLSERPGRRGNIVSDSQGMNDDEWSRFAKKWTTFCDGITIFYKQTQHLRQYLQHWIKARQEDFSIENQLIEHSPLKNDLLNPLNYVESEIPLHANPLTISESARKPPAENILVQDDIPSRREPQNRSQSGGSSEIQPSSAQNSSGEKIRKPRGPKPKDYTISDGFSIYNPKTS